MDIITNAVYFGIAGAIIMFLFNIFHCIFAVIFGVRIEKFGMLYNIGNRSFLTFKRNHTEYMLGWIPTGGYVKISGMIDESMDGESMEIKDYMLLSKPPIVRFICTAGAPILLIIPFIISASFIYETNSLNEGFQALNVVINNLYQYGIGAIDSTQAVANWNAIASSYNVFSIILCIMALFIAFSTMIMLLITTTAFKKFKIVLVFTVLYYAFLLYLLYIVGSLYFSLHSFTDAILAVLKYTVTIFIISYVLLVLIKMMPKNKYF